MIKEAYCSYEVSNALKEKGFNEQCVFYYKDGVLMFSPFLKGKNSHQTNTCSAPTQQMAMAWLREKNISIELSALNDHSWCYGIYKLFNNKVKELYNDGDFDSYEDAIEAALKYTFENLI